MPRSALHFSAISLMFDTPVPNWRSVMFLLFCAQIIGAPTELPTAAPASPAAPFRTLRRPKPFSFPVIVTSPLFVSGRSGPKDVHVLGRPGQNHGLARRYGI